MRNSGVNVKTVVAGGGYALAFLDAAVLPVFQP